jgi:hypothetical protein
MVEYITRTQFRSIAENIQKSERDVLLQKSLQRSPEGSAFLSHSSGDTDLLPGVILILENHGARVYVDKKDATLPPYTNRQTALTIRNRINQCSKFILLVTPNSKDSRWVPWELGLADGCKRARNVAILPSPDEANNYQWSEREYLGIYDRIVWGDLAGRTKPVWMVFNQEENTATELSEWLRM